MKRPLTHSLLIFTTALAISLNLTLSETARSLHIRHEHSCICRHIGIKDLGIHTCPVRHGHTWTRPHHDCLICKAFELFHTVFTSRHLYVSPLFLPAAGAVPSNVPRITQTAGFVKQARAPPIEGLG